MFLQIHSLTPYTGVLLNRDDVGFAKRLPVGNATRTRVSSQCLKRHWRTFGGEGGLHELPNVEFAVRSRRTFNEHLLKRLVADGVPEGVATAVTAEVMEAVLGLKPKTSKAEEDEAPVVESGQVTVLGPKEMDYLFREAKLLCADLEPKDKKLQQNAKQALKERMKGSDGRDWKKNLESLRAPVDVAMFGRMVTGDVLAGTDGAIHVAHAFTVHGEHSESDYFSAIDDLMREQGETGSGHINSQELTSGLFYGYVVVDVPLLVANLTGADRRDWQNQNRELAAELARRLVQLIATVSPGAKLGSTAPYSRAHFLCVEATTQQPRSLAHAFLDAVPTRANVLADAYRQLGAYARDLDDAYGFEGTRAYLAIRPVEELGIFGRKGTLAEIASFAEQSVLQ